MGEITKRLSQKPAPSNIQRPLPINGLGQGLNEADK